MTTSTSVQLHQPDLGLTPEGFLAAALNTGEIDGIAASIRRSVESRHATSTQTSYRYWVGRLRQWMEEPATRWRFRDLPAVPLESLWPVSSPSEQLIAVWLTDICEGPTDPDDLDDWLDVTGPPAPATLDQILAAVKAKSADQQQVGWAPSTWMAQFLTGLRRQLRATHGKNRQAEPLTAGHVVRIAEHLDAPPDARAAARDRVVLELVAAGVGYGAATRLRSDSYQPDRGALVIPGQARRGGRRDPDVTLDVTSRAELTAALAAHLAQRASGGTLLELTPTNPHSHLRAILTRTAERADVEWRPGRSRQPAGSDLGALRAHLASRSGDTDALRRRRDRVMLLVGYLCALRRSELVALTVADVEFQSHAAIVTIQSSKTDQDAHGARLPIHRTSERGDQIDAVAILADWVTELRDAGARATSALFPVLDRRHPGLTPSATAISGQAWSTRLAELAADAQVFGDDNTGRYERVSGHSLRRGFVTTAILNGSDPVVIAKQTRHRNISMIARYADDLQVLHSTNWTDHTLNGPG